MEGPVVCGAIVAQVTAKAVIPQRARGVRSFYERGTAFMASELTERFMGALRQLEQTGDAESLIALFGDDTELQNMSKTEPRHGREGARQFWHQYISVFDHIRSRFTTVLENGGTAVLEWVAEGALRNGQPLTYRGVSVLEQRDGLVRRFRTYYDSAVFLPHAMNSSGHGA